ncbi:hypothetical protein [Gayadomonas joobiniege]|uniref:hypothetical protein n=1 Tax=Gayadomonas joobiniege TaxID=1234606 RepID=UPI00036A89C6|nr:hypothetical protein [Gayadomonas joobiniege]
MNFIDKLLGREKGKKMRQLSHVKDLRVQDVVVFSDSFALPKLLRQASFEISKVNTYQFEHYTSVEYVLLGQTDKQVYLSYSSDDEERLNISQKINRAEVEQIFEMESFADIFETDSKTELELKAEPEAFTNWLSALYFQVAWGERGYFYNQDFRPGKPPAEEDENSLPLDYFCLTSADEAYSVELEVWQDGETDVLLTLHRPMHDIIDLLPGELDE